MNPIEEMKTRAAIVTEGSYWDIPERQRAEMDHEVVELYVGYELMSRGILRPGARPVSPREQLPPLQMETVYVVEAGDRYYAQSLIAFTSMGDAEKFMELKAVLVSTEYDTGDKISYAKPASLLGASIKAQQVASYDSFMAHRELLKAANAKKNDHERKLRDYEKRMDEVSKATSALWEDWEQLQRIRRENDVVLSTWQEYLTMTKNDTTTAFAFLRKAFSDSTIEKAVEWHSGKIPKIGTMPQREEEVEDSSGKSQDYL